MRAAIYGAGAMGTVLGAFMAKSGKKIDLVSRNSGHVRALCENGAHVTGKTDFTVKVNALTPEEMTGKYDLIFLMTKQRGNAEILAFLKPFLAEDGLICTMQNGLPEHSVAAAVGEERCLGCAVSWGATRIGNGVAELTSDRDKMTFALGTPYGSNGKIEAVKEYLESAGKVTVETNFIGARWAKLAINSAFSSVSAVTGLTFGEVAKIGSVKNVALKLLNEAFDVAEGCGVKIASIQGRDIVKIYRCNGGLKKFIALRLLPLAMRSHKNIVSGMYYDLSGGGKCDIDCINGAVARLGKKFGVPTPLNDKVLKIAHAIERGELQISRENIDLL